MLYQFYRKKCKVKIILVIIKLLGSCGFWAKGKEATGNEAMRVKLFCNNSRYIFAES